MSLIRHPTQKFPFVCRQTVLLSPVFCNHHFPNAFYKSPCNFYLKKKLQFHRPRWVCGIPAQRQHKVALNCLVGVSEKHCALWNKLQIRKERLLICFGPCSRAGKSGSRGTRWKWVTIYPCTRWLGSEWRKQRCSGNPSWLSAGTNLLEGRGPLLLGLAFLTLSSTSLSSTWLVSEESLGPECLRQV